MKCWIGLMKRSTTRPAKSSKQDAELRRYYSNLFATSILSAIDVILAGWPNCSFESFSRSSAPNARSELAIEFPKPADILKESLNAKPSWQERSACVGQVEYARVVL